MQKILSIVIPAYNVEKYIERTLLSVLCQNTSDIEVIVIDDGSTDQTVKKVSEVIFASKIKNIRILSKSNGGVSSARNLGLENATGEYIYFLDGDDYVSTNFVEETIRLVEDHQPQIIFWPYHLVDETGRIMETVKNEKLSSLCQTGLEILRQIMNRKTVMIWAGSLLYRKEFLVEYEIQYTLGCLAGEDQEFLLKAFSFAGAVLYSKNMSSFYYQRPDSFMNSYNIRKFDAVLALKRVREHFSLLNTPEHVAFLILFDEYVILQNYTGSFRRCLQYLIIEKKMRTSEAIDQLSKDIDQLYPGMRDYISSKLSSRKRKAFPDKIDVFRISPLLYMYLSRFFS